MAESKSLIHLNISTRTPSPSMYLRRFALPTIAGLLGLYIVLHSPLRDSIAAMFGIKSRGCFFCADTLSFEHIGNSLIGFSTIMIALIAAWIISDYFESVDYERPLIFGLGALAWIVVPAAIIGVVGERTSTALLRPPLGPLFVAVPALIFASLRVRQGWRPHRSSFTFKRPSNLVLALGGVAVTVLLSSMILSLMHPPTSGDALSYHAPLATFLWRDGNLGAFLDRAPDVWALAHPGMAELWFGLLGIVGGEPLADLGQLPFALLGSVAIYAFTRRLNMQHGAALLAGCAFLLVPIVVMQSGMQPNDIVGAALLMVTIALASAPVSTWDKKRLAMLGLGMGLVATTKLALLPSVAGVGLFVGVALLWQSRRQKNLQSVATQLLIVAIFFSLAVAPWWIRNVARFGNPLYPAALPLIGRGIFVHDQGPIDIAFVPSVAAWPLYPAIEPHDDRSGFGALVLVGMIPGFVAALLRGRRQPLIIFLLVTAITLPAWWIITLHEPRFLLGIVGLGFAFLPWSLLAVPRRQRRIASVVFVAAAIFSAMVTFDQALLPFARQPNTRVEFYDRVWGIDPTVLALPENEGVLLNTGYAPTIFEYTAYYPLLGASLSRLVLPVDSDATTESIVAKMHASGVKYAYVAASPDNRAEVEALYDRSFFDLVNVSTIVVGESSGARRNLYRLANSNEEENGTRRYLFRLR